MQTYHGYIQNWLDFGYILLIILIFGALLT